METFEKQFYGPMAENNKQAGIFIAGNLPFPLAVVLKWKSQNQCCGLHCF
jgi:hypothetical protein